MKRRQSSWARDATLQLVQLVKRRPCLYDFGDESAANGKEKDRALAEVSRIISLNRPGTTPADVQHKWEELCATYLSLQELIDQKKNVLRSKPFFFDQMEFLLEHYNRAPPLRKESSPNILQNGGKEADEAKAHQEMTRNQTNQINVQITGNSGTVQNVEDGSNMQDKNNQEEEEEEDEDEDNDDEEEEEEEEEEEDENDKGGNEEIDGESDDEIFTVTKRGKGAEGANSETASVCLTQPTFSVKEMEPSKNNRTIGTDTETASVYSFRSTRSIGSRQSAVQPRLSIQRKSPSWSSASQFPIAKRHCMRASPNGQQMPCSTSGVVSPLLQSPLCGTREDVDNRYTVDMERRECDEEMLYAKYVECRLRKLDKAKRVEVKFQIDKLFYEAMTDH